MAKQKDCELTAQWQRSIINHMYWCVASTPSGNSKIIKVKWLSLKNHIHGAHTGHGYIFPECAHGQLDAHTRKNT
jgi:solute carrier family 8 (sodium/calcium exchanger)